MINSYVGKKVCVTVAFATGWRDGGSAPVSFNEIITKVDEKFCELELESAKNEICGLLGNKGFMVKGNVLLNINYITSIITI